MMVQFLETFGSVATSIVSTEETFASRMFLGVRPHLDEISLDDHYGLVLIFPLDLLARHLWEVFLDLDWPREAG